MAIITEFYIASGLTPAKRPLSSIGRGTVVAFPDSRIARCERWWQIPQPYLLRAMATMIVRAIVDRVPRRQVDSEPTLRLVATRILE